MEKIKLYDSDIETLIEDYYRREGKTVKATVSYKYDSYKKDDYLPNGKGDFDHTKIRMYPDIKVEQIRGVIHIFNKSIILKKKFNISMDELKHIASSVFFDFKYNLLDITNNAYLVQELYETPRYPELYRWVEKEKYFTVSLSPILRMSNKSLKLKK